MSSEATAFVRYGSRVRASGHTRALEQLLRIQINLDRFLNARGVEWQSRLVTVGLEHEL